MGAYLTIPTTVRKALYVEPAPKKTVGPAVINGMWVDSDISHAEDLKAAKEEEENLKEMMKQMENIQEAADYTTIREAKKDLEEKLDNMMVQSVITDIAVAEMLTIPPIMIPEGPKENKKKKRKH